MNQGKECLDPYRFGIFSVSFVLIMLYILLLALSRGEC